MKKLYSSYYSLLTVSYLIILLFFSFTPDSLSAAQIQVIFKADLTKYVNMGIFNSETDKVYLRGSFNNWDPVTEMVKEASGFVYSAVMQLDTYSYYEYKYWISSPGASNSGFEDSVGVAAGKRYFVTAGYDLNLPTDFFNNEEPSSDHITITSPSTGEFWSAGSVQSLSWSAPGITNLKLEYTSDAGMTWQTIADQVPAADGKYDWALPDVVAYEWRIRVSSCSDPSDVKYSKGFLVTYREIKSSVAPLLKVEYPVFSWPLNAYYPVTTATDDENINGRVGNACGPTVIANILRYWEFPRKGTGTRSFTDHLGCEWSADFQNADYQYDRMPKNIPFESPDSVYSAAATLMYHTGVAMHNVWRNGAKEGIVDAMHEIFHYTKKSKFLERTYYTPAQWEKVVKSELSAGRPLLSAGPGHWFLVDGYNSSNLFHVRWDYGESANEYLPLYEFKPYEGNHWIFAYLEPELNGRFLHLTSPNGGENMQSGKICSIQWESTGVSNVKLEYTTNNGYDWITFADNIPASGGSYSWTVNLGNSNNYKFRISAAEDINIYDRSDNVFSVYDVKELSFTAMVSSSVQAGSVLPIRWRSKGIPEVEIQYSVDEGQSWQLIGRFPGTAEVYKWKVPQAAGTKCRVKIYDVTDPSAESTSGDFIIVSEEIPGGPYAGDANTAALLHFDGDFVNQYSQNYPGEVFNAVSFRQNSDQGLDYCVRIDNSGTTNSVVNIPNYSAVNLNDDWTIELWFKISSWGSGIAAYPFLLCKSGANYFIILDAAAKNLTAGYDYQGGAEKVTLPQNSLSPGNWYYLAFTRNTANNTLKCLLHDSTRQVIAAVSGAFNPAHKPKITANPVGVGGSSVPGNIQFDGFVDEVRVSNIVRKISSLKLSSPLPGEKLRAGSTYNIQWSAVSVLKVRLEYTTNDGQTWQVIRPSVAASEGHFNWLIPEKDSKTCRIRISDQIDGSIGDTCDNVFTIMPTASVTLSSPNGGELWTAGTEQNISWIRTGIENIKIEYCMEGSGSWIPIEESYPSDSMNYKWNIPSNLAGKYLIRVSDASNTSVYDISDGSFSIGTPSSTEGTDSVIPDEYVLYQNFPNPFNPVTVIKFGIPEAGNVRLEVYDMLGQRVKELLNEYRSAGFYQAEFNASQLSGGTYIYRIQSGRFTQTRKLLLLK